MFSIFKLQLFKKYNPAIGFYILPSYYSIQPFSDYWCKGFNVLDDCLVMIPDPDKKTNGYNNCIYSTSCDKSFIPICHVSNLVR